MYLIGLKSRCLGPCIPEALEQRSPIFLASGTSFVEDSVCGRGGMGIASGWFKHITFIVHFIIITLWEWSNASEEWLVSTDEASLTLPLLTCCCAAQFPNRQQTGTCLLPRSWDPALEDNSFSCFICLLEAAHMLSLWPPFHYSNNINNIKLKYLRLAKGLEERSCSRFPVYLLFLLYGRTFSFSMYMVLQQWQPQLQNSN